MAPQPVPSVAVRVSQSLYEHGALGATKAKPGREGDDIGGPELNGALLADRGPTTIVVRALQM